MPRKKAKTKKAAAKRTALRKPARKRKPAKAVKGRRASPTRRKKTVVAPPSAYPRPILPKPAPTEVPAPAAPRAVASGREILLGEVEDFFARINVIALTLKAPIAVGETLRVRGHTTNLTQRVDSMQTDHMAIDKAGKGDAVGIKVAQRCRKGDKVFRVA